MSTVRGWLLDHQVWSGPGQLLGPRRPRLWLVQGKVRSSPPLSCQEWAKERKARERSTHKTEWEGGVTVTAFYTESCMPQEVSPLLFRAPTSMLGTQY